MLKTKEEKLKENLEAQEELLSEFLDAQDLTLDDTEEIKYYISELFKLRDERRKLYEEEV